jgi:hypothetical protein
MEFRVNPGVRKQISRFGISHGFSRFGVCHGSPRKNRG